MCPTLLVGIAQGTCRLLLYVGWPKLGGGGRAGGPEVSRRRPWKRALEWPVLVGSTEGEVLAEWQTWVGVLFTPFFTQPLSVP